MTEEKLIENSKKITYEIKNGLLKRGMSQVELAELIGEGSQQVNRAIKGETSPKSIAIRQKIYRVLNIEV